MIAADLRIEGFDARAFTRLLSLFAPSIDHPSPTGSEGRATLIVVVDADDHVLGAFQANRRLERIDYPGFSRAHELPARHGVRRAIVLREGALDDAVTRATRRMHRDDDYVTQCLQLARALREGMDQGAIAVHPPFMAGVPLPTRAMLGRALDAILPDDHCFLLALWDGPSIWTAVCLHRRQGEIVAVLGPDLLLEWTGTLGGDWRRDHRVLARAVSTRVAPLHAGIFAEVSSLKRLLRDGQAGAWAKAVAMRDLIIHPTPPYIAVALGADALRRAATKSAGILGALDPLERLAPVATYLRGRVSEVASVTQALGFDPLKLLAQLLDSVDTPADETGDETADSPDPLVPEDPTLLVRDSGEVSVAEDDA